MGVPFLGRLPLSLAIREASDAGTPPAASAEPEAEAFAAIAAKLLAALEASGPLKELSAMPLTRDEDIAELLTNARTIAMVGASDRPDRPSYGVMKFLQDWGYRVLPVNPQITGEHVLGEFVWRELAQIGVPIDIVDIFRRPEAAAEAVEQAIFVGAKAVWMQLGVINEEAAARAEAAGLKVVMDRCPQDRDPAAARAADQRRGLGGADRHFRDEHRRRVDAAAELEVARRLQRREHVDEVGGDGDLGDRLGDLAAAHHEPDRAAAVIAGHRRSRPGRSAR